VLVRFDQVASFIVNTNHPRGQPTLKLTRGNAIASGIGNA
jgi:hypothetical protein